MFQYIRSVRTATLGHILNRHRVPYIFPYICLEAFLKDTFF